MPWDKWQKDGVLKTRPGKSISHEFVAHHLHELFGKLNIVAFGYDRWLFKARCGHGSSRRVAAYQDNFLEADCTSF